MRLPGNWCCYDPPDEADIPVGGLPARRPGAAGVTFGAFNKFGKVNDDALRAWGKILAALPGTRLRMQCPEGKARERVQARLARAGVKAERVEFFTRLARDEYFRSYHEIDLALDTFPFNGMTTTCDAL